MSETSSPLIAPKKNVGLKDKLCMKLDIKLAQSFGFDLPKSGNCSAEVHCCHSSPNLLAIASAANRYSVFTNGIFKVYTIASCENCLGLEFLQSKNVKSWESLLIRLSDNNLTHNSVNMIENEISFASIVDIQGFQMNKDSIAYCLKITTGNKVIFFRTNYPHDRDRFMYSLKWKVGLCKSRWNLTESENPKEIFSEIQKLVGLSLDSHLHDDYTHPILIDVISELFVQKPVVARNLPQSAFIETVAPLFSRCLPSREICDVFIKHCREEPSSRIVVETFTPVVQRILKETVNFLKSPWLRSFVLEYIRALNANDDGQKAVNDFLRDIHGPLGSCPHQRVLNNLVAVCLCGICQCFAPENAAKHSQGSTNDAPTTPISQPGSSNVCDVNKTSVEQKCYERKTSIGVEKTTVANGLINGEKPFTEQEYFRTKRPSIKKIEQSENFSSDQLHQLKLMTGVFNEISKFDDWCPGLASFLQPFPFPEEAMDSETFLELMYPIMMRFAEDHRGAVVQCLLHPREDKRGWLTIYSPERSLCKDQGVLFVIMVEGLLKTESLNRKVKQFLTMLAQSHLDIIITLAVRQNLAMINVLKDMLQHGTIVDEQEQLQVFAALRCTQAGKTALNQSQPALSSADANKLNESNSSAQDGPQEFTLAPNSTDSDLKVLLSSGNWSCLRSLNLSLTRVTSHSADVICQLPNLKSLNLWSTGFDDDGLKLLCDKLDLEYLNLCETLVTDDGIQHLDVMSNLQYLNLNSTSLQLSTFSILKEKLPKLTEYDVTYTDAMNLAYLRPQVINKKLQKAEKKLVKKSLNCFH